MSSDESGEAAIPEHARERMRAAAGNRVDPYVVSLLQRARDVTLRRGATDVTLSDVLEAMLLHQIQPALVHSILDAGSLAAERGDGYIGTEHVLLAMYLDEWSAPSQLLPGLGVDRDAMIALLRRSLDAGRAWDEVVRASEDQRDSST